MKNSINWFEIPVKNFKRAQNFYGTILATTICEFEGPESIKHMQFGLFPFDRENGGVGGVIVKGKGYSPSQKGSVVILNGGDDLNIPLAKVEDAGGKVVVSKFPIGKMGYLAYFIDSEGNRVALHSKN
jgi:uncharacterized protein